MHKKILTIWAALVVFAVAPTSASASPALQEGGANLAAGSTVVGTSDGNVAFTTSLGTMTCSNSSIHTKVLTNSGKLIEWTVESVSLSSCNSWNGSFSVTAENLHWCMKSSSLGSFALRGGGCNEAERALVLMLHFSFGSCKYSKSLSLSGTYKASTTPVRLLFAGEPEFTLVSGGFGCLSSFKLDAAYTLETTTGAGLAIT
jgi:hypothetical protein